jgi:tetratricopeptide (TPR) repeat protein
MSLPLEESCLAHISRLEQRQLRDPADLVLAHDLGLAHYWLAKRRGESEHWRGVIANWAMVLESDEYWQYWCAERSKVYGQAITREHMAQARDRITDKLAEELAAAAGAGSTEAALHLRAPFYLEARAVRLLRQSGSGGLPSPARPDVRLYCGPLLARQLGMLPQVREFFRHWTAPGQDDRDSVQMILAVIRQHEDRPGAGSRIARQQLRVCFSRLGTALVYLEREMPQRALDVLGSLRCSACESETGLQTRQPAVASQLPVRCRDDCVDFDRLNPSYASAPDGRGLFYRHAVELGAGAHLALAHQILRTEPADIGAFLQHIRSVLGLGQVVGIHELLRAEIVNAVLGWAEALGHDGRWDDAILLLESAGSFDVEARWKGKLASLLNARGVQSADEKRWREAVADLRRACELNPHSQLFYQNLENALRGSANMAYEAGDDRLAFDLLDEVVRLGEMKPARPQKPPSATLPVEPEEEPEPAPEPRIVLSPAELAHPALFDEQGNLRLEVFDDSGREVLAEAHQEAAATGADLLRVPALVLALAQREAGETARLLERQGIPPRQLQVQARGAVSGVVHNGRLRHVATLSQFDLGLGTLGVLDLAWEVAQYDRGRIGEPHILYGLLISRHAQRLLESAGADVDRMVEQAGWQ